MSTIALCIPAYNASITLPKLLKSAKNQTIPFDEIIIYNDCSTDNTGEIARGYGALVIEGETNNGCSIGKNNIAKFAKSEWLHFHDADDDLLPNFTQVAHKWINKSNAPDIVLMHYQYRDFVTNELLGESDYDNEALKSDPVKFNIINKVVNFAVIKKASFLKIGGFITDPAVLYNEDRAFYTKASIEGLSFDYEDELTCINYYYPNSMSANNKAKCAKATLNVWGLVSERTEKKYHQYIASQLLNNATYAAVANDWSTVKGSVIKARELFPSVLPDGSSIFLLLYKYFPVSSFFIREIGIRYFTSKRTKYFL